MSQMAAPCVGLIVTGNQTVELSGSQHLVWASGAGHEIKLKGCTIIMIMKRIFPVNYWIILSPKIVIGHNLNRAKAVFGLKEEFTQKGKLSRYVLILMPMENRVK